MVNWSRLPDVIAVSLLAFAFASVLRRNRSSGVNLWMVAWLLILAHFAGAMFDALPGSLGTFFVVLEGVGLVVPALIFTWSTVPHRHHRSSTALFLTLVVTTLFAFLVAVLGEGRTPRWLPEAAAILAGAAPMVVLACFRTHRWSPIRLVSVAGNLLLGCLLFIAAQHGAFGVELTENAILGWIYLSTCIHFCWNYRWRSAGSTITISGFVAWFLVFPVSMTLGHFAPRLMIESEIWNLPKYVVAVGMLLLLLEQQIERSERLARRDALTGLPNRRYYEESLETALAHASRIDGRIALLALDLDRFKEVNDTFGHHIGDALLCRVADVFSARIRDSDLLARTGGDEFALLLQGPVGREQAESLAESLCSLLSRPVEVAGHTLTVGVSVGTAIYPDDASDANSLSIAADRNMYAIKAQRRLDVPANLAISATVKDAATPCFSA